MAPPHHSARRVPPCWELLQDLRRCHSAGLAFLPPARTLAHQALGLVAECLEGEGDLTAPGLRAVWLQEAEADLRAASEFFEAVGAFSS